jgi:hypothetical protein
MRIAVNRLEMSQLHVDDVIITVHDPSPNAHESQHDHENKLVTMQSVGSDDTPLHRHDLACLHHLSVVPRGTTHSAHLHNRMDVIETSTMDGVSRKLASHRRAHNCTAHGAERTRNPTNCVDTHSVGS